MLLAYLYLAFNNSIGGARHLVCGHVDAGLHKYSTSSQDGIFFSVFCLFFVFVFCKIFHENPLRSVFGFRLEIEYVRLYFHYILGASKNSSRSFWVKWKLELEGNGSRHVLLEMMAGRVGRCREVG